VLIAVLYNTHTSTAIAFLVSTATLTVASDHPGFLLLVLLGLPFAILLSGGFYLRVLEEGVVEAGREIHLVDRPHREWSVARAMAVLERVLSNEILGALRYLAAAAAS